MKFKEILAIAALAAMMLVPALQADVFYSHPYDPNSTDAVASDNYTGQYSFADYYWDGGGSITDFHWWGAVASPFGGNGYIDGFQVEIWSHDGTLDRPDQQLYSEYFAGDAGATFVESNANYSYDVYKYGVDLSTPFTPTASGYLWFSVWAHVNYSSQWYWALGNGDPYNGDMAFIASGEYWAPISNVVGDQGFAFELSDDGSTVPEPTTLALFGFGLVGLAMRKRRRQS